MRRSDLVTSLVVLCASIASTCSNLDDCDLADLAPDETEEALALSTDAVNRLGYLQSRIASHLASLGTFEREGERSAAHQVARRTGVSVGQAKHQLDMASRTEELPALDAALREGHLSPRQGELIADAALANPEAEKNLIDRARASSFAELRDACTRAKAEVADLDERRDAIHKARYLRTFTDTDGAWNMTMRDNVEVGAEIEAVIRDLADRRFTQARKSDEREPVEAYRADAMIDLARSYWSDRGMSAKNDPNEDGHCGSSTTPTGRKHARTSANTKIIVRIDLDALLRGYPIAGEVSEISGLGAIAPAVVRDLIDTGDPFLTAVATKGEDIVGVVHLGRRPSSKQLTALQWLYPTCAAAGCSATTHLESDHRMDWAETHITLVDLMDRLCTHHHDLKSSEGWMLIEGKGKRAFVPPDDPRHPKFGSAELRVHGPPRAA